MVSCKGCWCALGGVCATLGALWFGSVLFNRNPSSTRNDPGRPQSSLAVSKPTDEDRFVGNTACRTCHREIWEAYRQHPMGRSLAIAREATEIENFDVTEFTPPGARCYRIERTPDAVLHHEVLLDQDGSVLYDQAVEARYTLGSGKRGRAYLIERDGMLFKSSIAWFSNQKEWGLSPGYPPAHHKRFERRITEGCINCHVGRMAVNRSAPDRYLQPVVQETEIGCERCHGPGRDHVTAQESGTVTDDQHIINPSRLDPSRRDSICAECHLHGKATVVRTGQRVFDFRPGQRLEDNRIVFVTPPGPASRSAANALSQVEQMSSSACFQKSNGRMGCTSCHDPHSMPAPETRIEFYRAKCLTCHNQQGCTLPFTERQTREPADSCIACHMPPALHVGNILHVSFSDHRILRQPDNEATEDRKLPLRSTELVVFDQADQRLPKLELDRARAFMLAGGIDGKAATPPEARLAEQLLHSVRKSQPDDLDVLEVLGAACLIQGRAKEAEKWWLEALKRDPRRESVLQNLAILYFDQQRLQPAREYLERFIEVNPWHGHIHGRLAGVYGVLGEWNRCAEVAEHALELNPTLIPLHNWLEQAYRELGKPAESERHRQLFERLNALIPTSDRPPPQDSSR